MNRLIIQEIEKILARSVIDVQKESKGLVELIATDLVTGKKLIFRKERNFNINGAEQQPVYTITENRKFSKKTFPLFHVEKQHIFDMVYNRYRKYFAGKLYIPAKINFYQMLLKNNNRTR